MPGTGRSAIVPGVSANNRCAHSFSQRKKNAEEDKINALALGDDYITKPFSPRELVARVNAHLRRDRRAADQSPTATDYVAPQLEMDLLTHSLWIEGQAVPLVILGISAAAGAAGTKIPHRIYSPEQLFEIIWKAQGFDDHAHGPWFMSATCAKKSNRIRLTLIIS